MKKRAIIPVFFVIICLLCIHLYANGIKNNDEDKVRVFYLTTEKNALIMKDCSLKAESVYGRAGELLDLLALDTPGGDANAAAPISGFELKEYSIDQDTGTISVEFTEGYRKLDNITEKLTRAAIVNTLCGIPDIRRVTIRINGALIVDDRGNKSENMTADQFIYNSGKEMLNFERAEMHLYFASRDGKKLVESYRTVVFNGNIPMERLVVEQIIAGPNGDFNYPTVNENTKIVNILSRDNICTVTLDRTFLTNPYEVDPEVAVYSIVNSLTELPSINQVQIIIDGVEDPLFMETYLLDTDRLLQKNTKIVQTRE